MMTALFRPLRATLATAVLLAVPAFAVYSLIGGGFGAPTVELARGDDPIRNGLRIVDEPVVSRRAGTVRTDADDVLVTDWMFTGGGSGKGKPSPYQ
jgi:hypothetical protein